MLKIWFNAQFVALWLKGSTANCLI